MKNWLSIWQRICRKSKIRVLKMDEILELYELTIAEAKAEVAKGTICDAKTLFAIQYWELYLLQRQFKEDTQ